MTPEAAPFAGAGAKTELVREKGIGAPAGLQGFIDFAKCSTASIQESDNRPQKITFDQLREMGVRDVLVYAGLAKISLPASQRSR